MIPPPDPDPQASGAGSPTPTPLQRDPLRTDDLHRGIRRRAVRGGALTLTGQGLHFVIEFGLTIVLARVLDPADFGLVAMVRALTGFVDTLSDGGLSAATVRNEEVTHEQVSGLFWINSGLGFALAAIVALAAPVVAWFYDEPRLLWVTLATACTFAIVGVSVQHAALIERRMRFKSLVSRRIVAQLGGAAVALSMALSGFGYWSLVGQTLASAVVATAMAWLLANFRPSFRRPGPEVRSLMAFGGYTSGARILVYIRRNIDNVVIGAMWGPAALGLYRLGYRLILLPIQQVNSPISNVMIPTLSRLSQRPVEYRAMYRNALYMIASISLPFVIFMLITANDIIGVFLGEKWLPAVPIFQALGPGAVAGVLNVAAGWVFVTTGRVREQLLANIYLTVLIGGTILACAPWGPIAVAIGFSASFCVSRVPHFTYAFRGSPVSLRDVGDALLRPALATAVAASVTLVLTFLALNDVTPVLRLAVQAVPFVLIVWLGNGHRALRLIRKTWSAKG
jgi:PST family polysaccharide transporter